METKMAPHYHIHVYFNQAAGPAPETLKAEITQNFPALRHRKFHEKPIGPHPAGQFVVYAPGNRHDAVKSFLEANNKGLSILIHPVTGDDVVDHDEQNTEWINAKLKLDTSFFGPRNL